MAPNKQKGNRSNAPPAVDSPPKPSLEDLFLSLDRHVQAGEYKQIVKVADQSMLSKAFVLSPSFICYLCSFLSFDLFLPFSAYVSVFFIFVLFFPLIFSFVLYLNFDFRWFAILKFSLIHRMMSMLYNARS